LFSTGSSCFLFENRMKLMFVTLLFAAATAVASLVQSISPKPGVVPITPAVPIVINVSQNSGELRFDVTNDRNQTIPVTIRRSADGSIVNVLASSGFWQPSTLRVTIGSNETIETFTYRVVASADVETAQAKVSDNVQFDLPTDFAPLVVATQKPGVYPSPIYIAQNSRVVNPPYAPYIAVLDSIASPITFAKLAEYPFDVRVLPSGQPSYTVFQAAGSGARVSSDAFVLDTLFRQQKRYGGGFGYPLAMHGFFTLPNGNRIQICQENFVMNMSTIVEGGHPAASIQQSLLQEVDPSGLVLFQWRALDHFPVTASFEDLKAASIRVSHLNSVWVDSDNNFLLSLRHFSCIAKVNRETGAMMWIMGGKLNQFTFTGDDESYAPHYFSYQHDIRRLPNGNISMFDNGTQRNPQQSRAVEYEVNEASKTVSFVWDYRPNPPIYVSNQGAVQTLPNGNRLVAWGVATANGAPAFTEVTPTKEVVLEVTTHPSMAAYKVEKSPYPAGRWAVQVSRDEVLDGNDYEYASNGGSVGVWAQFFIQGTPFYNETKGYRKDWAPVNPQFLGTAPDVLPMTVFLEQNSISSYHVRLRFQTNDLGLTNTAQLVKVYRRSDLDSGVFEQVDTRYNSDTQELIVDSTTFGEFCFGIPRTYGAPIAPIQLTPVDSAMVSMQRVVLRSSPQGQRRAQVFRVSTQESMQQPIIVDTVSGDRDTVRNLDEGRYYWTVATLDEDGVESAPSPVWSFVTAAPFITHRSPSTLEWSVDRSYGVLWNTNVLARLRIELVSKDNSAFLVKDSVVASDRAFLWRVPANVPPDTGYRVRITPIDSSAPLAVLSDYSISIRTTSIEVLESSTLTLAPNPVSDILYIGGSDQLRYARVYSSDGSLVIAQNVVGTGTTIPVSSLPAGTYTVVLETLASSIAKPIVVIR
jgi:hypothetical protein